MERGLEEAIVLAVTAHKDQKDKANRPYILHPLRVMMNVKLTAAEITIEKIK